MAKFEGVVPQILKPKAFSKFDNGHWVFDEQMGLPNSGFIYVIRDNFMKRLYLGKKVYLSKAKATYNKENDWRRYISSSKELALNLKERPRSEFDFIVLEQYKTKGTLSYSETWSLCLVEAPTNQTWYNTRIESVSWPCKEPITERHKHRLELVRSWSTKIEEPNE